MSAKIVKTDAEWRARLSDEQYRVTRKHGTERPLQAATMTIIKAALGCICCGAELFHSDQKFDSGTGWPSFTAPSVAENIGETSDRSFSWCAQRYIARNVTPFRPCF